MTLASLQNLLVRAAAITTLAALAVSGCAIAAMCGCAYSQPAQRFAATPAMPAAPVEVRAVLPAGLYASFNEMHRALVAEGHDIRDAELIAPLDAPGVKATSAFFLLDGGQRVELATRADGCTSAVIRCAAAGDVLEAIAAHVRIKR